MAFVETLKEICQREYDGHTSNFTGRTIDTNILSVCRDSCYNVIFP